MNGKGLTVLAAALLALGAAGCAVEAGDSDSVSDADRVRQTDVLLQAAGDDGDPGDPADDGDDQGDDGLDEDVWVDEGSDFGPGTGDNPIPEPWHLRNGQEDNGDPDTKAAAQGSGQSHDK